MIEIALRRSFSGVIARSAASRQVLGGASQGWQDKSADLGRAHVIGWVGIFGIGVIVPAGACRKSLCDFNRPCAVTRVSKSPDPNDDAR